MYEILQDRGLVEVSGTDSLKFLQGLITNDIIKHRYCYTYMLSNQGRYLFDFFVLKISDNCFLIDISLKQLALFMTKLMMYKLRAKVDITNKSQDYSVLYSKQEIKLSNVVSSNKDSRYEKLGFRTIISKYPPENNRHPELVSGSQHDIYLEDKYDFTIPDGEVDLIYDKSIPLEFGAEELKSIDYNKGCYVGQELISRTKYQGVIRKKIFKVIATGHALPNSDEFKNIGILCSSYKNLGIALINEEKYFELIKNTISLGGVMISLSIPSWRCTR